MCEARAIGQEKCCVRCSYMWDMNDEPPVCKTEGELQVERNKLSLERLRKFLRK